MIGASDNSSNVRPRGPTLENFTSRSVPLGRAGTVDEVAAGVVYLASDESRYTSGSALVIDGGRSIS